IHTDIERGFIRAEIVAFDSRIYPPAPSWLPSAPPRSADSFPRCCRSCFHGSKLQPGPPRFSLPAIFSSQRRAPAAGSGPAGY
ncbi:MAG: DUF933 domain-containing protein, partial [Clostridia bacterium]|nr:DUF933 domain-containing protein [Clostridia bacterium]